MSTKLIGKVLASFEAKRDVWQEVLDGIREIKAGGGKKVKVEAKSYVVGVRIKNGLSQCSYRGQTHGWVYRAIQAIVKVF